MRHKERKMYAWLLVLTVFEVCGVYSAPDRRQALGYVVEKGCMYMAHYVRDNYYDYEVFRRQATPSPSPNMTTSSPNLTTGMTTVAVSMTTSQPPASSSLSPLTTTHINWVSYVYDIMRKDYVPMELFRGLMDCGPEYALFAINAPDNIVNTLQVDYSSVPGLVG